MTHTHSRNRLHNPWMFRNSESTMKFYERCLSKNTELWYALFMPLSHEIYISCTGSCNYMYLRIYNRKRDLFWAFTLRMHRAAINFGKGNKKNGTVPPQACRSTWWHRTLARCRSTTRPLCWELQPWCQSPYRVFPWDRHQETRLKM